MPPARERQSTRIKFPFSKGSVMLSGLEEKREAPSEEAKLYFVGRLIRPRKSAGRSAAAEKEGKR